MTDGESFTLTDLGATIARLLGLEKNDTIEIQRNKLDPNEIKVLRHPSHEV
jgi:antitoxin (DNA-binding transcriptional repressor) of toxin-antitoxin stability system